MLPYFVCTVISCMCLFIHTKLHNPSKKIGLFIMIGIVIPCILAGARDSGIGTDMARYGDNIFYYAKNHSISEFYIHNREVEPLYLLFVYVISLFTGHIFWQYFMIEFFCITLVYLSLVDNKLYKYSWLGLLVFHLMFYSFTLNLMRQFMAMSIILWAFRFIRNHQFIKYSIAVIIAFLFHRSGLVGVAVYIIYILSAQRSFNNKGIARFICGWRWLWSALMILSSFALIYFAKEVFILLSVFKSSYKDQLINLKNYEISSISLLFMTMLTIIFFLCGQKLSRKNEVYKFYTTILIISTILWQIQGISAEAYRVVLYIWYFVILAIPSLIADINKKRDKNILTLFFGVYLNCYYFYIFVIQEYNGTYPYTSKILGIG